MASVVVRVTFVVPVYTLAALPDEPEAMRMEAARKIMSLLDAYMSDFDPRLDDVLI